MENTNEATYNFGKEEYTKKNLTPTEILDLAFAYTQTPITRIVGKKLDDRIKTANDVSRLTGMMQLEPTKKSGKPALILHLLKNSLVTKDEYIKLFKELVEVHKSIVKYLKNASPERRNAGAAKAAAKDMKGEFDESVNESKEEVNPQQLSKIQSDIRKINSKIKVYISKHPMTKGELSIELGAGHDDDSEIQKIYKVLKKHTGDWRTGTMFNESVNEAQKKLPKFKNIPSWAKYVAQHSDGEWFFYEETPTMIRFKSGGGAWKQDGNQIYAGVKTDGKDWDKRPTYYYVKNGKITESVNENKVDKLRTAVQKINRKYQVKVSTHPVTKGEIEIILGRGNHPDNVYHSIEKLVSKLGFKRGQYSIFDESVNEVSNDYSPMAYAKFVAKGKMSMEKAMKDSGYPFIILSKLVRAFDRNYKFEGNESDADMAVDQLQSSIQHAQQLVDKLKSRSNLEPWVQSLITKAEDYLNTVNNNDGGEEEIDEYDVENYQDVKEFVEFMENYKPSLNEAEYQGRKVELGKIMQGDVKKFKVYVNNDKGNVVKVNFGQKGMVIKKDNPDARKSFRARMNCDEPGPRWKARYWSCRKW